MLDSDQSMEVIEFKRLLDIGLGRAILFLHSHDATPYRDVILNACLHNMAFYRDVEGSRAGYMLGVIDLTGQQSFYRQQILSALHNLQPDVDYFDVDQLLNFARFFALDGDSEARDLIYTTLNHKAFQFIAALQIIDMDGIRGCLHIASQMGRLTLSDPDYVIDDFLYKMMKDEVGEEALNVSLRQSDDPGIAAYLERVTEFQQQRNQTRRKQRDPASLSYTEVQDLVMQLSPGKLSIWGQYATESNLLQAAHDLEAEGDPPRIRRYLAIFQNRPFPLDIKTLLSLVNHEDEWTARVAIGVLEDMEQPAIRAFALDMLEKGYHPGWAAGLLTKNYQDGDWQLIEKLTHYDLDREEYHSLGFSVLDFYEAHPFSEASTVFLTLYDRGPCANCRRRFLEHLQALNAIPAWIIQECHHDSNADIREMFSQFPSNHS